jgi:hypothetical protein
MLARSRSNQPTSWRRLTEAFASPGGVPGVANSRPLPAHQQREPWKPAERAVFFRVLRAKAPATRISIDNHAVDELWTNREAPLRS